MAQGVGPEFKPQNCKKTPPKTPKNKQTNKQTKTTGARVKVLVHVILETTSFQ
jgi:hypothetical protein